MSQNTPAKKKYIPDRSKLNGYKASIQKYTEFYGKQEIPINAVNVKFFQDFADFLINYKKSNEHYSCGTVMQYLSGAFNTLRDKYPKLLLWKEDLMY